MKTMLRAGLAVLSLLALAPAAEAGLRGGFFVGTGCGPRYYAPPPVCVAPRLVYPARRVVYCAPAPVVYYAPVARPVIYRAPLAAPPVVVSSPAFGWRR